jgi:hypothetical protein
LPTFRQNHFLKPQLSVERFCQLSSRAFIFSLPLTLPSTPCRPKGGMGGDGLLVAVFLFFISQQFTFHRYEVFPTPFSLFFSTFSRTI